MLHLALQRSTNINPKIRITPTIPLIISPVVIPVTRGRPSSESNGSTAAPHNRIMLYITIAITIQIYEKLSFIENIFFFDIRSDLIKGNKFSLFPRAALIEIIGYSVRDFYQSASVIEFPR